jgi:long-subunit acyl-CoA synthetase (AMP-forming)
VTIAASLVAAVRDYPDRRFLHWIRNGTHITWTYAEAAVRIAELVTRLEAAGARAGDHVVVHTAAMVPSILFDLACACAGIVLTPLETAALPEVLELCRRVDARAVLTTPDRNGPYERPVIHEDGTAQVTGDTQRALAMLAERAARITDKTPYMLQPTSGTTGGPKLAIRDHVTFVRAARLLAPGLSRTSDPPARVLMVPALTHGMGQYLLGIGVVLAAEYCVTTQIDVRADLAEIRALDPTFLAFTPRVVRSLFAQRGAGTEPLFGPSAALLLSGGASPDKDLLAAITDMGVDVIEGFGASEFSVVAVTRRGQWRADILGHVVDDVKLRVTDEGELHAWTPGLMHGYHGNAEATRAAFTEDGFYKTGDRVAISPDGELRYLGRLVDSFNLFDGSHVEPGPVEDALTRLPWLDQLVLLGDQRPYIVGLAVVRDADREQIVRDVTAINETLPQNARVRRLAILSEPFPEDIYLVVGHGKTRRSRKAAIARYAAQVEALYGAGGPDIVTL